MMKQNTRVVTVVEEFAHFMSARKQTNQGTEASAQIQTRTQGFHLLQLVISS